MALSQRRAATLLDAVGGRRAAAGKAATTTTTNKRASPARSAIPVKPPVVKEGRTVAKTSRIPVTSGGKTSTPPTSRGKPASASYAPADAPVAVPASLNDLSWKFSSDSRAASPDVPRSSSGPGRGVGGGHGGGGGVGGSRPGAAGPPIRPKAASLRKAAAGPAARESAAIAHRKDAAAGAAARPAQPAAPARPAPARSAVRAEEQAIRDLQELVRRQQEELEEYQHDGGGSSSRSSSCSGSSTSSGSTCVSARPAQPGPAPPSSSSPLWSCALVQQAQQQAQLVQDTEPEQHPAAVEAGVVVVDAPAAYTGPLQVKTVRLEDQDLPHDVLQDPRLAATRSRLNQRLQHLLDEVPDAGKLAAAEEVDVEHARPFPQGAATAVVVADLVDLSVTAMPSAAASSRPGDPKSDPRRRSVFFVETPPLPSSAAVIVGLTERKDVIADRDHAVDAWAPQELYDEASADNAAVWSSATPSAYCPAAEAADSAADGPGPAPSHKDQYHEEIRQLLQKLNADEAVFPAYAAEPIYATAVKRRARPAAPLRSEETVHPGRDVTSISPLKQKGHKGQTANASASAASGSRGAVAAMGPVTDDDGDSSRQSGSGAGSGLSPGSDLSLGSSSDNTSGDDGIGDEPRSWSVGRGRGRGGRRVADSDSRDRDLSMDSGIQGSHCDLEGDAEADTETGHSGRGSSSSTTSSEPHEDEPDMDGLRAQSRPTPIGGCEVQPLAQPHPRGGARPPAPPPRPADAADAEAGAEGMMMAALPEGEAFKVVEELYVADAAVPPQPPLPLGGASASRGALPPPLPPLQSRGRIFTETHFDSASAPNLALRLGPGRGSGPKPGGSAPVGLDSLDAATAAARVDGPLSGHVGVGVVVGSALAPSNSSVVSLPNVQQLAHSASVSSLCGPSQPALLSPPEPFRRAQRPHGQLGGQLGVRQSKRFSSADDVFRASLLRHSLPAKPPRSPSVRASLEEGLPQQTPTSATTQSMTQSMTQSVAEGSGPAPQSTSWQNGSLPAPSSAQEARHQVVVAIDFGTTYSGYAFCYARDPDCNIHMMRKWEGGDPGLHNEKAPTALLLTPEAKFHSFGFLARDTFHDLHPDQAKRWLFFDKFKMALLSQTTLTRETALPAANGRQVAALTVLSLSLSHLRQRALAELAAADQGHPGDLSLDGDLARPGAVRWVLTVPALWGPSATQLLREAAHQAGLAGPDHPDALLIVLEPEAASLCCRQLRLHQLADGPTPPDRDHPLASLVLEPDSGEGGDGERAAWPEQQPRTQYMVVDCGGGTVDITVHELSGHRATLRELHKASGGACGSLGVDREFERLLSAVFGADFMSHFRRKRPAAYVELLLSFEARKRSADPDAEATLNIFPPFAFVEAYRKFRGKEVEHAVRKFSRHVGAGRQGELTWSSQGMLRLSPSLMADLFRPTLDQVCQQVEEVLRSPRLRAAAAPTIQYLFLVGGFAQSLMLQHRVRTQFGSRIKVVVPQAVGLTTLRGAVLYGLDPSLVASRRSKHTLGVGVLKRFQPGEHPQDKLVTLSDGSQWCSDVLDVLVVADQPLGPGEAVTRSYTPASARQTNIIIHIYCCSDTSAPKFVTDSGVTRCGTLSLSLDADRPEASEVGGPDPGGGSAPTSSPSSSPSSQGPQPASAAREIVARIEFGGTELAASAQDVASGRCVRTQLDFLSTAV